jgi:NAD(P)H-hydrate epimerase
MDPEDVPYLTTEQMIEVDRAMVDDLQIDLIQMMENAGRNLAHLARRRFLESDPAGKSVVVLAGTGGNGGGALVAARRLWGWGAWVRVFTTKPAEAFHPIPARQLEILRRMQIAVGSEVELLNEEAPDLILDGVIGYHLKGAPEGGAAALIRWANARGRPILSLDTPSGLDTTTGRVLEPAIRATATMTLALPKAGLRAPGAEEHVGELYLADVGVPPSLYARPALGLEVGAVFAQGDVVRLR